MKYILPFLLLLSTIQVSLSQESPSNITKIEAEIKSLKDKLQKYKAQNKAEAEIRAVEIDLENERKVLEWAIDAEEDRKVFKGTTMDYVHKWYTMIKSEFGSTVVLFKNNFSLWKCVFCSAFWLDHPPLIRKKRIEKSYF